MEIVVQSGAITWFQIMTPILGFTGVVITLAVNAWLARHVRAEERSTARTAVLSALLAELEIVRDGFANTIATLSRGDLGQDSALIPTTKYTFVFDELVPQLGMLPKQAVKAVVYAYMCVEAYHQNLILVCGASERHGECTYAVARADLLPSVVNGIKSLMVSIDDALLELRSNAN